MGATHTQQVMRAGADVEAEVRRVLERRRKTNSSGQDGEDADHIRAALIEAMAQDKHQTSQQEQLDLFAA